ncbi:MAG: hypothetical protein I3274_03795 [Candidatus Moeniiplasma glomeromycotorum]|nr:hypothetical protein [Candidatus Moeniiplasma glomeromycotorum]
MERFFTPPPPPPPPQQQFITDLYKWGQQQKVKRVKAEYEIDADGWYLEIKEIIIENTPTSQCWFCNRWFPKGSSKCSNKSCENYSNDSKGSCKQCGRNDYLVENEFCITTCFWTNFHLTIQQKIKEKGLKEMQADWEQKKTEIERLFENLLFNLERTDLDKAKTARKNKDDTMETIETDLYPKRKKQEDKKGEIIKWVVIGGVIIVIAVIIGVVVYLLCRKKKK